MISSKGVSILSSIEKQIQWRQVSLLSFPILQGLLLRTPYHYGEKRSGFFEPGQKAVNHACMTLLVSY